MTDLITTAEKATLKGTHEKQITELTQEQLDFVAGGGVLKVYNGSTGELQVFKAGKQF